MGKDYLRVTTRDLAKSFISHIPIEFDGDEFRSLIDEAEHELKKLPKPQRQALRVAFVFASKVPKTEREEVYQELALTLLEKQTPDVKLAYAIARCDWMNWWRAYKIKSHYGSMAISLESLVDTSDEMEDMRRQEELLVGECEFEAKMCDKIEAKRIWSQLPREVKALAQKRLLGKALTGAERVQLHRFIKAHPMLITQCND